MICMKSYFLFHKLHVPYYYHQSIMKWQAAITYVFFLLIKVISHQELLVKYDWNKRKSEQGHIPHSLPLLNMNGRVCIKFTK